MKFVGADLHKKSITFCVVSLSGTKTTWVSSRRILCRDVEKICEFFKSFGDFQVTVEATLGYDWFAALAEQYAQRVVVAHAGKLRVIAESTCKTDKIDARILADFLALDMIPHDSGGLASYALGLATPSSATPFTDASAAQIATSQHIDQKHSARHPDSLQQ